MISIKISHSMHNSVDEKQTIWIEHYAEIKEL